MCVSLCVRVCICACVLHVSVLNIICSAGPEVAVFDWYGPADLVYWRRGRGMCGRTPGSV